MSSTRLAQRIAGVAAAAILVTAPGCGKKKDDSGGTGEETTGGETAGGETTGGEKPSDLGYEEIEVADGGTIAGTATYAGDQQPGKLEVTKDQSVCTHGGEPDQSIVVNDGKLKNVLVYLVDVKKGKKWADGDATVDNKECLFDPRVAIGRHRGNAVARNSDPVLHNTNMFLRDGNRSLGNLNLPTQGQERDVKLKKEGLVDVKCDVHPWMKAFVWVSKHPYVAVSGEDGTFTMDKVPPGDYKAKAWHEVFGEKDLTVTVAAGGAATLDVAF